MDDRQADRLLVERARSGERGAFDLLVVKYQRRVARLVGRYVRDTAEAEDVVQEAFIKAYRALGSFRGDAAFYTWLYRIAVNTAKNYLAAQSRRMPLLGDLGGGDGEDGREDHELVRHDATPERELLTREIAQTVSNTLDTLPEELATALTLREMEGLSYEEIAEVMGCPIGTVRSRIYRAREAVADKLRPLLGTSKDRRW